MDTKICPKGDFLNNMDKDIHFEEITNKNTNRWIVLVHGFVQNSKLFKNQIEYFKKEWNILTVDLRGHGLSVNILGPYGIEEYADDIEKVIVKNNITNIYYWGTHTGTGIGYVLYFRQAERFRKLIMEGSILPGYEMKRVNELIERAREIAKNEGIDKARNDWFYHADWYEYIRNNKEKCRADEHLEIIKEFNGKPWLSAKKPRELTNIDKKLNEIKVPLLLYNGEKDMEEFNIVANRISNKANETKRAIISNAGAFPCWENYEEVNEVVEKYLNEEII